MSELKPLRCPYCGGRLMFAVGVECDDCGAGWDQDNVPRRGPVQVETRRAK